jgi:hypothetical protein
MSEYVPKSVVFRYIEKKKNSQDDEVEHACLLDEEAHANDGHHDLDSHSDVRHNTRSKAKKVPTTTKNVSLKDGECIVQTGDSDTIADVDGEDIAHLSLRETILAMEDIIRALGDIVEYPWICNNDPLHRLWDGYRVFQEYEQEAKALEEEAEKESAEKGRKKQEEEKTNRKSHFVEAGRKSQRARRARKRMDNKRCSTTGRWA